MRQAARQPVGVVVESRDAELVSRSFDRLTSGTTVEVDLGPELVMLVFEVPRGGKNYLEVIDGLSAYNAFLRARARSELGFELPSIYDGGLGYAEENVGGIETYRSLPALFGKGTGDCGELVAARACEPDVVARGGVPHIELQYCNRKGCLYHVTIRYPDGSGEDPSSLLGMRPEPRKETTWLPHRSCSCSP